MNEEIRSALMRVMPFAIILFILLMLIKKGRIKKDELDLKRPVTLKSFLLWTIGFLLFVLAIEILFYKLGKLQIDPWDHPLVSSIVRIIGAVLLAPIAEELIFRGLILNALKKKINIHAAIFVQACFFVLLHNFAYENTFASNVGIVQGLIDATLFSYARIYTRSLYTPMCMHMTGNFVAVFERFLF